MRETKFRFWDKKRKVMMYECVIGGFTVDLCNPFNIPPTTHLIPMQYTGLKDKNGKEIYEGDIVKFYHSHCDQSPHYLKEQVIWDENDTCYYILPGIRIYNPNLLNVPSGDCSYGKEYLSLHKGNIKSYMVEIVGNIYKDLELLKQKNET